MSEERLKVLEMLSSGKISAEEADKLLEQIAPKKMIKTATKTTTTTTKSDSKKFLKIKILSHQGDKVNVQFPLALAKVGLSMAKGKNAEAFSKYNIDVDTVIQMIEEGADGEIVDISSAEGDIVKICVE